MTTPIVLPADVYDTLDFSALAYGGIGGGSFEESDGKGQTPCCIYGHSKWATDDESFVSNPIANVLMRVGISANLNDNVVYPDSRISFKRWCRRLNVARGA